MADVETAEALLVMALQDLGDAEAALVERLPTVRGHTGDEALRRIFAEDAKSSAAQQQALAGIARKLGAKPIDAANIWLRAVLDDAANDARTIARGPLRDIALAGALRKGKQSERVSYETAIRLAERLELVDAAKTLTAIRDEEAATDRKLARAQRRLCGEV